MKMPHSLFRVFVAVAAVELLGMGGCSSMKVETDWSPEASFTDLHSYSWMLPPTEEIPDTRRARREAERRSEIERRLFDAVNRELAGKGYQLVSEDPDFLVAYFAAAQNAVEVTTIVSYWGYASPWIMTHGDTRYYREGALILDVVDPTKNEVIWRGVASAQVDDPAIDEVEKKVNEAVQKILSKFPPKQ